MAGGIKLQWKDRNFSEEQHRIYKSDTPMTLGLLPSPIATLGSNITEYIDYDVIEGNTYYYRISAVRGNDEAVSDEFKIVAEELGLGPGPQELIMGNSTDGYFGEISSTEFITSEQLSTDTNFTIGTEVVVDTWFKFSIDNKIIYMPKNNIRLNVSWNDIYANGMVYGNNTNGLFPNTIPVIQNRTVTIDNYDFYVRLIKGANTDPSNVSDGNSGLNQTMSEWIRTYYKLTDGTYDTLTDEELNFGNSHPWCQETSTSNSSLGLIRGTDAISTFMRDKAQRSFVSANRTWRPVLELIQ